MNGDYLLIVGASYEQEVLIQKAKEMGFRTVVIDIDENAPGLAIADRKAILSTLDIDSAIEIAKEYNIVGVLTNASESAIMTVAHVAQSLFLPGNSIDVANKSTNKELMKCAYRENNLPTANYFTLSQEDEAVYAANSIGYPCIIKPIDGAGSRGVLRIDNEHEVIGAMKYSVSYSKLKRCIIEEFIEGIEMSADALSYNGKTEILALSEKRKFNSARNNVAMNIIYPPRFSKNELLNAKELIIDAVNAIGITDGPSHTEIIRRGKNDFMLLETASRGGGFYTFSKVVPAITGIDTMAQLVNQAIGRPIEIIPKKNNAAVLRFIDAKPGIITKYGDLRKANRVKGVIAAGYFKKIGEMVSNIEKDGDRIGYMIISAKTRKEAIAISDKVNLLMKIITK